MDVVGSVLYIAAHPDDENTSAISYLAKGKLLRTGYLSLTRGDGGQNLIGPEQSEQLGVIRTQELLEARKRDGGEQFFTRAIDFGYTKSSEETFEFWDKEKILSDVVWVIRKFKPDIIITQISRNWARRTRTSYRICNISFGSI
ncbi:MAG: PIG-L family deacetylase [Ignavibacteriales bacterium]|nr:PIG-L family deacetylase [Ignavibacteriales bacterium]